MTHNNIAIIGASGGIGSALVELYSADSNNTVHAFSRSETAHRSPNVHSARIEFSDEMSIQQAAELSAQTAPLDYVIVATGILHDDGLAPEKSLRDLSAEGFNRNFLINTIGPALAAKHFLPKLQQNKKAVFAALSARVGSISDNRLGGWYAYRASKAALNMVIKSASIEMTRRKKQAIVVGLHPGTVATALSRPFQQNVPSDKLFSANYSATQLHSILESLSPEDSGKVFAWDGSEIPF